MVTEQTTNPPGDAVRQASADLDRPAPADLSAPGQLVAAREAAGLSASEVAGRLGMATRQIEALERGDWDALPGPAFVRAALRSYGKAVGVDVTPLLSGLGSQAAAPVLKASATLESPIPRSGGFGFGGGSSGAGSRLAWIVLGIVAVLAIVFYFGPGFQFGSGDGEPERVALRTPGGAGAPPAERAQAGDATNSDRATAGVPASGASVAPSLGGQSAADNSAGRQQSSGGSAQPNSGGPQALAPLVPLAPLAPLSPAQNVSGSSAAAADAPAGAGNAGAGRGVANAPSAPGASSEGSASADRAASGAGALRLRFERESWVEIREAGGKVLLSGIQAAGSERSLTGARPISLVIGNAQHVRLEHEGQPVDLAARSRQGVARFTLE
jgi:cytoskeleton protein RodZ